MNDSRSLTELVRQCGQIEPSFGALAAAADVLSPYVIAFRHSGDPTGPTPEEADQALQLAREAFDFVTARLPLPPSLWHAGNAAPRAMYALGSSPRAWGPRAGLKPAPTKPMLLSNVPAHT
jgi:hypothetical protein